MTAVQEAWRAGLFRSQHWAPNVVSGFTVGIVALPLAMAFAIASGVKPEHGIYTAIVAGLIVAIFGGSRVQIAGPTGAFVVILAGITAEYGFAGLQIATLMAGIILMLLGIARLGNIIKFIPDPVIVGFTAGIGVIIFFSQWQYFFGLPDVAGDHFHTRVWQLMQALPSVHPATTGIALGSLLLTLYSSRLPGLRRIPGPLTAMVAATVFISLYPLEGVATIGSVFGGIPSTLPVPSLPEFTLPQIIALIGPAFTIAMLGAIESLLSAVVADGMGGTRHDSNQELIGQGMANIVAPILGGFAATGAIARTATNVRNGGTSPLAGIVHALTLILIVLLLAPLASNIPLAALAAILFVVAWNMSEVRHFANMIKRAPRMDVAILLITFLLTVFVDLVVAVNIGVILAMLHFLRRMASSVEVLQLTAQDLQQEGGLPNGQQQAKLPPGVLVFAMEGPFFFGAVENFERALLQTSTDPDTLIIRLKRVPFMDITGLQALEEVIREFSRRGIPVLLCEATPRVKSKLEKAGILALIGTRHYFERLSAALEYCITQAASAEQQASTNI
jgi:sulfate permease, SulP family